MIKLIFIGLLAGAFFSSTFILNELMSDTGGHWFWSASLRYAFMFGLLSLFITIKSGVGQLVQLIHIFVKYWRFWCITGGVGFGIFYAGICYAGDHASGWVVASTFMFTVVASLFVLSAFGQHFPKRVIGFAVMIFTGVVLVNLSEASHANQAIKAGDALSKQSDLLHLLLFGALPALIAAFSYPIGNQLVWQVSQNAKTANPSGEAAKHWLQQSVPTIKTNLLDNAFNKIWLMTLGSFPLWIILGATIYPPLPAKSQVINTFLVALFSGVIATGLFLYAREKAKTSQEVAGVDATQASEVVFALIGGITILGTPLPSPLGFVGIALIVMGLLLFAKYG